MRGEDDLLFRERFSRKRQHDILPGIRAHPVDVLERLDLDIFLGDPLADRLHQVFEPFGVLLPGEHGVAVAGHDPGGRAVDRDFDVARKLADIAEIAFLICVGAEIFGRGDRFRRRAGFCRGRDDFRGGGWGSCCLRFGCGCRCRNRIGDGVGGRDPKRKGDQDERGYGDRGDQDR